MRKLKTKYKKKFKKKFPGGDLLKYPIILTKLIKIKKVGRWCEYYADRLPYPIECQSNAQIPLCHDKPNCIKCRRKVHFQAWKAGMWDHIKFAIKQGEDLTELPSPNQEVE